MSVTIKDLTSITTPADSAEVWIQDSTQSAPIDRRWSLTNLLAWVKSKLGTAAQSDDTDFLETADYPSDSAWTTVTSLDNDWTGTVRYIKRAGVVFINVTADGTSATGNTMLTLPSGYRPAHELTYKTPEEDTFVFTTAGSVATVSRIATTYMLASFPVL